MIVTRTQPAINIFYSWHYKLNSPSLAGFWENIAQFRFCQFFSQIQTKSSCFVKPFNISEAWIRQETQEFSALIPENFTRAQKYFAQVSLLRLVKNSMSPCESVTLLLRLCWCDPGGWRFADDYCFCLWINLMSILMLKYTLLIKCPGFVVPLGFFTFGSVKLLVVLLVC